MIVAFPPNSWFSLISRNGIVPSTFVAVRSGKGRHGWQTGDTLWTSSRANDRGAGHASIVIAEIDDTRVLVQTTGSGAMGVRASDGRLLWTYDIDRTTAVVPTPIVRDDLVFFTVRGSASVVAADGHLYVRYDDGRMTLVQASPKRFQEVGDFKIPHSGDRPSWSHPVIAEGRLYLREGDEILCYDLRG